MNPSPSAPQPPLILSPRRIIPSPTTHFSLLRESPSSSSTMNPSFSNDPLVLPLQIVSLPLFLPPTMNPLSRLARNPPLNPNAESIEVIYPEVNGFGGEAKDDTIETPPHHTPKVEYDNGGIATTSPTLSTSNSYRKKDSTPLKPNTVIVVCVLTSVCSIIFILLLYIKHCLEANATTLSNNNNINALERKNSGVDRSVVESLPLFRFKSLKGHKEGLECAICLKRFEDHEVLRLLPRCNHAFHFECVDEWLNMHSTCPLCRDKVDNEDVIIVGQQNQQPHPPSPPPTRHQSNNHDDALWEINNNATEPQSRSLSRRMSTRHSHSSTVGGSDGGFSDINSEGMSSSSSRRRSFDNVNGRRKTKGKRKDGMLMTHENKSKEHRLEHRIIVSPTKSSQSGGMHKKRWSNVEPFDLLYLTSEMIISQKPKLSSSLSISSSSSEFPLVRNHKYEGGTSMRNQNVDDKMEKGGMTMNRRSVSETIGMNVNGGRGDEEERHEGAITRWLAWISKTH
ncbi:hypothetical protein RIF29_16968 [Crotalaria pallida]|uniref:RING-type E3 ubiquitin transferase n=1 Tax=Crotalaria pallida TaxID=3830 RepID=A0AAN9IE33_CROPI